MSRLAIFSDVHGNLHALQAVWEAIERERPQAVVCLGDLVGYGAHPNEVIDFLRAREVPTVMGNYDEGVGHDRDDCGCVYADANEARLGDRSLHWSRERTSPEGKDYLRRLPRRLERPGLLMVHGSPRRINEYLYQDRRRETFERIAGAVGPGIVAFGHTHLPYLRRLEATWFVNVGSVGRPLDGDPRAGYVLLTPGDDPQVEFRRVAYDTRGAAAAVRDAGLPEAFAATLLAGRRPQSATVRGGVA